jgi:hypothetical protein
MDAQVAWPGVRDRVIAAVGAMRRAYGLSPVLEPVLTAGEIPRSKRNTVSLFRVSTAHSWQRSELAGRRRRADST